MCAEAAGTRTNGCAIAGGPPIPTAETAFRLRLPRSDPADVARRSTFRFCGSTGEVRITCGEFEFHIIGVTIINHFIGIAAYMLD